MISIQLAKQLKEAGLVWRASINDYFGIPDRGMDERVFVISDLQANLDVFRGWPVVTFHGSAEWALDYILTTEVVWLPHEEQLRKAIVLFLEDAAPYSVTLAFDGQTYHCTLPINGQEQDFRAETGSDAYGLALLSLLKQNEQTDRG
ncbi:MAG: hypothetical protein R3293_22835 [Candidatus Promineifilaceae bacterium]|nr:hypothetical protein [Candidatus Promineifilaceae bacterium]